MAAPVQQLPPPVTIDPDTKRLLVAGVKKALVRMQKRNLLPAQDDYGSFLSDPDLLGKFISTYNANREQFEDLACDAQGRPITDDTTTLECGVTLPQLEQMLVFTCGRRLFLQDDAGGSPANQRKLAALTPLLAFRWQLPLLEAYRDHLSVEQIADLGMELLLVRARSEVAELGALSLPQLHKARQVSGPDDFQWLLRDRVRAVRGLQGVSPRDYALFRAHLDNEVWAFFARDEEYLSVALNLNADMVAALGPKLAKLETFTLQTLSRLPAYRAGVFVEAFFEAMGDEATLFLCNFDFVRRVLRDMVERLSQLEGDSALFAEAARLKLDAFRVTAPTWAQRIRSGRVAPATDWY